MLADSIRQHLHEVVDKQKGMGATRPQRINAFCAGLADQVVANKLQKEGLSSIATLNGEMFCEGFMVAMGVLRHHPEFAAELAQYFEAQRVVDPTISEIAVALLYPDDERSEDDA